MKARVKMSSKSMERHRIAPFNPVSFFYGIVVGAAVVYYLISIIIR